MYPVLTCTFGCSLRSLSFIGLYTGISSVLSAVKSSEGMALDFARVSRVAASRICQIGCSFSNLISVLVGWIFTSMVAGSRVR